jgi:phage terminase small subunit
MINLKKTLTDKQIAFIENFSQTGNATKSAIKSGYSSATAEQQGYELKNKLSEYINEATEKILGSTVPMAVSRLNGLISDDKVSPAVRLGAINSLLDRTGFQTTHKVQDVTKHRTDKELQQELNYLLSTIRPAQQEQRQEEEEQPSKKGNGHLKE